MRQLLSNLILSPLFAKQYGVNMREMYGEEFDKNSVNFTEYYETLISVMNAFDKHTYLHLNSTEKLAYHIGSNVGLGSFDLVGLSLGALLHDIGKIGIEKEIIARPGPITAEERVVVETHTSIGGNILSHLKTPWLLEKYAYMHHERLDGSGYPNKLLAENIPLQIRIMSVVDVAEALLGDRPYRIAWTPAQVIDYLYERSNQFDSTIIKELESYKF